MKKEENCKKTNSVELSKKEINESKKEIMKYIHERDHMPQSADECETMCKGCGVSRRIALNLVWPLGYDSRWTFKDKNGNNRPLTSFARFARYCQKYLWNLGIFDLTDLMKENQERKKKWESYKKEESTNNAKL